jgi:hypothetical protein
MPYLFLCVNPLLFARGFTKKKKIRHPDYNNYYLKLIVCALSPQSYRPV